MNLFGVRLSLPMKGVSMLLGNELTGGKVTIHIKVLLEPVTSIETEKTEEENPRMFPSRALIRAQAKGKDKERSRNEIIDLS